MEQPTFNCVIEPHSAPYVDLEAPPVGASEPSPIKPHREKAELFVFGEPPVKKEALPEPPTPAEAPDPLQLLQALGAAFAVGGLTGALLCYAFSGSKVACEA